MQGGYFSYALLAALATALLVAAVTDFRRREIDNWLTAGIALAAPLFWISTDLSLAGIGWQLGMAAATFAVLVVLFILNLMGGGDVKLLTALSLWIQPLWYMRLLVVMSLAGGALTLVFAAIHFARKKQGKCAVPYGIAISLAGLWTLASQYLPTLQPGVGLG